MAFRTSVALNLAPLCLRFVLAATFLWAGFAKVAYRTTVDQPRDLAKLVEWGVVSPQSASVPGEAMPNPEAPVVTPPPVVAPPVVTPPAEDSTPEADPGVQTPPEEPATDEPAADEPTEDIQPEEGGAMPVSQAGAPPASADVKRVIELALLIERSANPGVSDEGQPLNPIWPKALAKGNTPVVMAWVAAILELVCGAAMLVGFFTRLAALPLAGTMLAAMWLTQIGPAVQQGTALFGFLPPGPFEMGPGGYAYTALLWQFSLLMSSLAMVFLGAGFLSVDRLLFGGPPSVREGRGRHVEFVPMSE